MQVRSEADLINRIQNLFADNNSGAISAMDLRDNVCDTVSSINNIVASGNHDVEFPFFSNVRATSVEGGGIFIAESGVSFPNGPSPTFQTEAYPGSTGIQHNDLAGRNSDIDAHTQYLAINGERPMEENLPMSVHWIGASGAGFDDRGLRFVGNATHDDIMVGTGGSFVFSNNSKINNGRSVAKAWMTFDGAGAGGSPQVMGHFNIDEIEHLDVGKYRIFLTPNILEDANFLAIGSSNSRSTAASQEDFERNTVGITQRSIDGTGRANLTFLVLNEAGEFVDAQINDLIVYGFDSGDTDRTPPTITPM